MLSGVLQHTWSYNEEVEETLALVLEDISGLGRCAILFLSPEEPGPQELKDAALTEDESWAACCCAICIRW